MEIDVDKPVRRNTRLAGFDYTQAGAYLITVVTRRRVCVFGDVVDGEMRVNPAGEMVDAVWRELPAHYPGVKIDWHVVMPNHFHGIVVLTDANERAVGAGPRARPQPNADENGRPQGVAPTMGLSDVLQRFKSLTTNEYIRRVASDGWPPFSRHLWQRSFHDHIIRDDDDLARVREYIALNPAQWADDEENLANAREHERRMGGLMP
ncbi:MAG TPA: transposase [Candidatus Latescibacteria bacterium]|nr:transposase [Candidatus Latescibacterota bacterium]